MNESVKIYDISNLKGISRTYQKLAKLMRRTENAIVITPAQNYGRHFYFQEDYMLNSIILQGRLTANPELRQTDDGIPYCNFSIAVHRPFQKDKETEVDFINHTAWRNTAEFIYRNFKKGQQIITQGNIRTREYVDKDNIKRQVTFVNVDNVHFSGVKNDSLQDVSADSDVNKQEDGTDINPIEEFMNDD